MERLADVQNPAIKLSKPATVSQAQIQTRAQLTTPEKYMNTAEVYCNKRLNIHIYVQYLINKRPKQHIYIQFITFIQFGWNIWEGFKTQCKFLKFNHFFPSWNLRKKGCDVM